MHARADVQMSFVDAEVLLMYFLGGGGETCQTQTQLKVKIIFFFQFLHEWDAVSASWDSHKVSFSEEPETNTEYKHFWQQSFKNNQWPPNIHWNKTDLKNDNKYYNNNTFLRWW